LGWFDKLFEVGVIIESMMAGFHKPAIFNVLIIDKVRDDLQYFYNDIQIREIVDTKGQCPLFIY
jgi:hypothetical protein